MGILQSMAGGIAEVRGHSNTCTNLYQSVLTCFSDVVDVICTKEHEKLIADRDFSVNEGWYLRVYLTWY